MPSYPNDQGVNGGAIPVRMTQAAATAVAVQELSAYPVGATPVVAVSGVVANAVATATIAAVAGKTNYISGIEIASGGATLAALVNATISGLVGGVTITYPYAAVAGVTLMGAPLVVQFFPAIPANAANTAIVAALPALGAGNTAATVTIHGYRL